MAKSTGTSPRHRNPCPRLIPSVKPLSVAHFAATSLGEGPQGLGFETRSPQRLFPDRTRLSAPTRNCACARDYQWRREELLPPRRAIRDGKSLQSKDTVGRGVVPNHKVPSCTYSVPISSHLFPGNSRVHDLQSLAGGVDNRYFAW